MSAGLFGGSDDLGEGLLYDLQFLKHAPWLSSTAQHSQVLSKKHKEGGSFPGRKSLENTAVRRNETGFFLAGLLRAFTTLMCFANSTPPPTKTRRV